MEHPYLSFNIAPGGGPNFPNQYETRFQTEPIPALGFPSIESRRGFVLSGLSFKRPDSADQGPINVRNRIARMLRRAIPQGNDRPKRQEDPVENPPDDPDVDPFDPFPAPVHLELTDVFDLHSIPPRDIKRAVVEYLCEARRLGFKSVRIIHGKGIGVQREAVRKILSETPFVTSFGDAPPDAGGWGATIARLSLR